MKDESEPDLAAQMQAARELLEEGEIGEALLMAMEVLWQELEQSQDALWDVQEDLPLDQEIEVAGERPAELTVSEFYWPAHIRKMLH